MKAIVDADSLIYASAINKETLEECVDTFNDYLNSVLSDLREYCEVSDVILCNGGSNALRKAINPSYKENRKTDKPTFLTKLHKEVKTSYQSAWAKGYETDDVVASLWKHYSEQEGVDSVIIVANDKDYKQFPCWYFDMYWRRRTLDKIEELESKVNFYTQMIVGDTADNINYLKGKGKAYAKKLFKGKKTEKSLLFATYREYVNEYGSDAREKFKECYDLLTLRTDVYDRIKFG